MKIRVASDLHVDLNAEYYGITTQEIIDKLNLDNMDMLILAGDTAEYPENLKFIKQVSERYPELKIIEIPGNHLYYSCQKFWLRIKDADKLCKYYMQENKNYYFLNKNSIVIDGIKFIGATMWTKCGEYSGQRVAIQNGLNDFRYIINDNYESITVDDVIELHEEQKKFIVSELNKSEEKCVVITHHAPFFEYHSELSHAFGIDLDRTLKKLKHYPEYWIYGHTHINKEKTLEYENGNIKCVTNQMGYKGETLYSEAFNSWSTFDSNKEIEL